MNVQNLMNSLWDIRIFLGPVPKESPCIIWRPAKCSGNSSIEIIKKMSPPISGEIIRLKTIVIRWMILYNPTDLSGVRAGVLRRHIQIPRVGASRRTECPLFNSAGAYRWGRLRRVGPDSRSHTVYRNHFLILAPTLRIGPWICQHYTRTLKCLYRCIS